jgi:hypothetical protein
MNESGNISVSATGNPRQEQALSQFRQARKQATMERLMDWFTGKSAALLS